MPLSSMTGFGRSEGVSNAQRWSWEVRSVNGRNLDLRVRLPNGAESLEAEVRTRTQARLKRGNCQIVLNWTRDLARSSIRVNAEALDVVTAAVAQLEQSLPLGPSTAAELLALRGVLEVADDADAKALDEAGARDLLIGFDTALGQVVAMRNDEGLRLQAVLVEIVEQTAKLTDAVRQSPARSAAAIATRMAGQVGRLTGHDAGFDEQRLHQEAILLAAKADVQEELDRLDAHVAAARSLLQSDEPVGRKLDFLAQEFHRECNTLCSKSNDVAITSLGMELKSVVDQLREQIQNIE